MHACNENYWQVGGIVTTTVDMHCRYPDKREHYQDINTTVFKFVELL